MECYLVINKKISRNEKDVEHTILTKVTQSQKGNKTRGSSLYVDPIL